MTDDLAGKRVTVLGLGHFGGGSAVARWLVGQGAVVTVVDQQPAEKLADGLAALEGLPVTFHLGSAATDEDFSLADLVVASPAVPPASRQLAIARDAGVAVTTEICLFVERCAGTVFGVTGTKGKSTTTALLGRMLKTDFVGGNIGRSLLPELPRIRSGDRVVLELSSFMLAHLGRLPWSPHVAVVTMIDRDHLDWHGSAEAYLDAKANIVRHQSVGDFAVLPAGIDDRFTATPGVVLRYPLKESPPFELAVAGPHNQMNAQAAYAAAAVAGVSWDDAQTAVRDFGGLPHRLQAVAEIDGVRYVNDSIATNPAAAIAALHSYPAWTVLAIVGGSDKKHLPLDELCDVLNGRAKMVLTVGETGPAVARMLTVRHKPCGTVAAAVEAAKQSAVAGDVVLLSPGHPSYDQFVNYEARGRAFADAVKDVVGAAGAGPSVVKR